MNKEALPVLLAIITPALAVLGMWLDNGAGWAFIGAGWLLNLVLLSYVMPEIESA